MTNYYNSRYNNNNNNNINPNRLVANNQLMNEALYGNCPLAPIAPPISVCKSSKSSKCDKKNKCTKSKCKKHNKYRTDNLSSDSSSSSNSNSIHCSESECRPPCQEPCPIITYDPCANTPRAVTTWRLSYLVANLRSRATHYDVALVQPRGISVFENQLWVANTMSDKITNYDFFGNSLLGAIQVRQNARVVSFPSSVAINCGNGFNVPSASAGGRSALFVTATKTGDISIFNPSVDPQRTYLVYTNKELGIIAEYTGLTIASGILYLADFFQGKIDVFGSDFGRILGFKFVDDFSSNPIPLSYGPHNITYIAPYLYVMYAERQPGATVHHVIGPNTGYISVFNLDGSFVRRFYSQGVLNAPWAMIPAPCEVGIPPGSFLVGNIGDGRINIFTSEGIHVGPLISQMGIPLVIPGLQGLAAHYTNVNEIFFTSSEDIETLGLLGSMVRDKVITADPIVVPCNPCNPCG